MVLVERRGYNILELLGDIGGFYDAMYYIGYIMTISVSKFALQASLLSHTLLKIKRTKLTES